MTDWTDERPTVELVKQTVTMAEVAEMLGYDPDHNDKIRPPWNEEERTPSCQLYEDHFYDFATGKWGDFVDFIQAVDPDMTHSQAVHLTWTRALRSGKEPGDVEYQEPRKLEDFSAQLAQYPMLDGLDPYGRRRDGDTVLVPHREVGRTYGVKTRRSGAKGAWPGSQFTHRLYHPFGWALNGAARAVICEGESDAWALDQHFGSTGQECEVFGLPAGANSWKDHWLDDLDLYETVHLCMDNDQAGKRALDKLTRKVGWDRAETLKVPSMFNDAREAIEAGWEPRL